VRFADHLVDSDDDNIPLGQAMLSKRGQEERVKRTQKERLKESAEEEKRRMFEEEERVRIARARQEREELAKAKYAEEFAAARHRIESQRAGGENYTAYREARTREREPSYSRPKYDSSKSRSPLSQTRTSEADVPSRSGTSRDISPGSSRPASVYGPPSVGSRRSSMLHGPSSYSASVEDLNGRSGHRKSAMTLLGNGYPHSDASGSRVSLPRSNSSPVTGFMYPTYVYGNIPVPPVPQMPWAMPLLPPMPAFMLDSYPSSPSTPSRESSPSRQNFPAMPVVGVNYYGIPQTPSPVMPHFPIKGASEAQMRARQTSFGGQSESKNNSSRNSYALPASHSSRELRQVPSTESTSKHTRAQYNRRTTMA
jgi:hypothetical protein